MLVMGGQAGVRRARYRSMEADRSSIAWDGITGGAALDDARPAARDHRERLHAHRSGLRPTRLIIPPRAKLF